MAPSDAMDNAGSPGEAPEMPVAAKDDGATQITPNNGPKTFPRFMDLPPKIRKQIRTEAIKMDMGDERGKPFCSWLSTVSKEWKEHVEEILFSEIQIDPMDDQQVSIFFKMFLEATGRRRFLKRLNIAIDDSDTGPWHQERGLVQIGQIMAKIGQLFWEFRNRRWAFAKDSGGRPSIDIVFVTSRFPYERMCWPQDHRLNMTTSSLWEDSRLETVTGHGSIPTDLPLWAIKSEFPSSLKMVTHLSIPPDCLPLHTAEWVIGRMPNLQSLVLEPRFDVECDLAWSCMTELVVQVERCAQSLRSLTLSNTNRSDPDRNPEPMDEVDTFARNLRLISQLLPLESLCANPFELSGDFFRPFSPELHTVYPTDMEWPKLRHLDLQFFNDYYYCKVTTGPSWSYHEQMADQRDPDLPQGPEDVADEEEGVGLTIVGILIAAGRATMVMPVLESVHLSIRSKALGNPGIYAKRKLCPSSGRTTSSRVWVSRISFEAQRIHIMKAWADFLGPDPRVDEGLMSEFYEPCEAEG